MPVFSFSDANYFDLMTPDALRWAQAGARAVGEELGAIVMAEDPNDPVAPIAILLQLPPGYVLERHAHACHRVEVIVRGSLDIRGEQVLHPGDISVSAPGEFYGPNIGGPEGSLSVEIFSTAQGMLPIFEDVETSEQILERRKRIFDAIDSARSGTE